MSELNIKNNSQFFNIGDRLRKLREARGISIRSLSKKCGLAVNTLSLIENEKTSPSVNTLSKIAESLGIPITAFFDYSITKSDIGFTKISEAFIVKYVFGKVVDLGSQKTVHPILPYLLIINPKSKQCNDLMTHSGYEFVYCFAGKIEFVINSNIYSLEIGDSLLFDASLTHNYQNNSDEPASLLITIFPIFSADSIHKYHFPVTDE